MDALVNLDPKVFAKKTLRYFFYFTAILVFFCFLYSYTIEYLGPQRENVLHTDSDFTAYLTGAEIIKAGKVRELYSLETQNEFQEKLIGNEMNGVLSYRNPPLVALLYLPYTYIEPVTAFKINFLVQLLLIVLLAGFISRTLKTGINTFLIALVFLPTALQLYLGQIAPVIGIILTAIFLSLKKDKFVYAGLLSGLLLLKPQYLIAIPYILVIAQNRPRFLKGLIPSLLGITVLNILLYGYKFLVDYPIFLTQSESRTTGTDLLSNYNLLGVREFLIQTMNISISIRAVLVITAVIYAFSLYYLYKNYRKTTLIISFSSIIIWLIPLSVHTMITDLIFLLIPLMSLIGIRHTNNKKYDIYFKSIGWLIFITPLICWTYLEGPASVVLLISGFLLMEVSKMVGAPGLEPGTNRV